MDMSDTNDDGQAAYHADQLKREQDEEEALRRVIKGTATLRDAETLARALGHNLNQLMETP